MKTLVKAVMFSVSLAALPAVSFASAAPAGAVVRDLFTPAAPADSCIAQFPNDKTGFCNCFRKSTQDRCQTMMGLKHPAPPQGYTPTSGCETPTDQGTNYMLHKDRQGIQQVGAMGVCTRGEALYKQTSGFESPTFQFTECLADNTAFQKQYAWCGVQ